MKNLTILILSIFAVSFAVNAQTVKWPVDDIKLLTKEWTGERTPDGRRGIIFNGSVRDFEGLSELEGFNGWIRGSDPSAIEQMMCATVYAPIRIGRVTVLPGDVVLAKTSGVDRSTIYPTTDATVAIGVKCRRH